MKGWTKAMILVCLTAAVLIVAFFFFKPQLAQEHRGAITVANPYNADEEVSQALEQLKNNPETAMILTGSKSSSRQIALTFDGLTDRNTIQQIIALLQRYNGRATFFADGILAVEYPETLTDIQNAGQKIESYTLVGQSKMEAMPIEKLVYDFCRTKKIIRENTRQEPALLKCNDTKYTAQVLQAAKAAGFTYVVQSDVLVNVKQFSTPASAAAVVASLRPGSIVSVRLKNKIELFANEQKKKDVQPAVDKQPGLKEISQPSVGEKEVVRAVENLLIALQKAKYSTVYVEDIANHNQTTAKRLENRTAFASLSKATSFLQEQVLGLLSCRTAYAAELVDHKSQEIKMISTTEPALSYTFGGLAKRAVVDDVLNKLNDLGIKATFFVAESEMRKYPETVRKIIANGHEIGIAIVPKNGETFDEICKSIILSRQQLQEQFGVTTSLVKQPWGVVTDTTREAVAAVGCQLIGQSLNIIQSKHKDYTSAEQVINEIFGKSKISLARGQIVHFRMDFYTNDKLVADLLEMVKQRKVDNIAYATSFDSPALNHANDSSYRLKPVGEILTNKKYIYQYPVDPSNVSERVRNNGRGFPIDQHNFLSEVEKRYIGNEDVTYETSILGFSKMDVRRLDKQGFIHTEDNVIFLTFDDWGTDAAINKILYVLRKHQVAGTFFIITHNVAQNPNLLRTIAMQGHDIGCHSDLHKPMVVHDPRTGKLTATQDKEEYTQELAEAYQKLLAVVGDATVNGRPALTKFFRPPALAISKTGLESLFADGYEYSVSGSCSTNDYKAESVPQLVKIMKDGVYTENGEVKKGAVLVMHMTDRAAYTAMSLDILLTANEAKPDSDPSKFKVGRLSDYLIAGYSQIDRKKTLQLVHSSGNLQK
ncbi:polysaccharide deacetylase family protein [Sporomusa acidovorans]|uniref:NodB homology domain-containing protein n=1 Tax=Sporomusa acidovorans (strain ATCC 49682 / DSM 3132 / Mol) TaxID=1123286 RepID=A0ABZ3JAS8_SPOA4|nr:polysaccharide deacetylase family protein [Sporomusa acidovorans]OZC13295.1 peptidoglycan-N-acetylmuramic acid deacetylase PdaA precursor [Sporomusa acidovorans DSM 3132]SDD97745.1 Polysaccharide deacetylase [Sporomusa acidovorans]